MTAHRGVPDPAAVQGSREEIERTFHGAFLTLERRITLFLSLPFATLEKMTIQEEIRRIGKQ